MTKRILAAFLCLLLVGLLPVPALAAQSKKSITLTTPEELLQLSRDCILDSYSVGLQVRLGADIDMTGLDFGGIPIFSGSFDGRGYKISGLNITSSGSVTGLFRYLTREAVVKELHLEGNILPQGSRAMTGGIAGSNAGKIENCSFSGRVSGSDRVGGLVGSNTVTGVLENCTAEGSVDGNHFVGGIAGENMGVLRGCVNGAQINATPQQNAVEISDITIDALTGSESAATVTDIGGIAGTGSGVIRDCENRGTVGYKHMGYNVGGIVGSQSGLVSGCKNYGAVSGRKEVGGIVGHLKPGIRMEFSVDTLQKLRTETDTLSQLTGKAAASAQGGAAAIGGQVGALRDHAQRAEDALDQLLPSVTPPGEGELLPDVELPDPDSIQAAQNALSGSITGMQSSMEGLLSAAQGAAGALSSSMQAVMEQLDVINETIAGASEDLGGGFTDVSDEDTAWDTTGKVADCENHAPVLADLNAGGIAGAMALEVGTDPEKDVSLAGEVSLNFEGMFRAVVRSCGNYGSVTAKKQNTGGIVGWMDMGLVRDCLNTGTVAGGDYTGGIAGSSSGFLRACSAKCRLTGDSFAGGIAGQAEVLTDCRSMTELLASEKTGAVLGMAESRQEIRGNYYLAVGEDPGAIDGISYDGCAQGLEQSGFLRLPGIHRMFRSAELRFCFEDGSVETVKLSLGKALRDQDIPAIPEKTGHTALWEGLEDRHILFDTDFHALYTPYSTVIASSEQRQNGKPILLAEGSFSPEAAITLTLSEELPEQADTLLWQSDSFKVMSLEDMSDRKVLEVLSITLPGDCGQVTYRYLPPEEIKGDTQLLVRQPEGNWEWVAQKKEGSYLVFEAPGGQTDIALLEAENRLPLWIFAGIAGVILVGAAVTAMILKKRKNILEKS